MRKIILASASPRRHELLEMIGVDFDVLVFDQDERRASNEPEKVVLELSFQKAEFVAEKEAHKEAVVIGADTVVCIDGCILGKPSDKEDAYKMISRIQGRSHYVYTGVTIIVGSLAKVKAFYVKTEVIVAEMSEDEIQSYIETDEPYDKAGAYGIQGLFGKYVEGINGDFFNVVGLPVRRLYEELRKEEFI